jgi:hypothetical protein
VHLAGFSHKQEWPLNSQSLCQGPPHHPVQHEKVREQPLHLGRLGTTVWDIQRGHLPRHHHPPRVNIFGNVQVRRQPKNLSKAGQLHMEPLAIGHPQENPLFLVIEESGIELNYDLLIPIVPKLQ